MANASSPAAESDQMRAWRALVDSIKAGEAPLGERLYLLGAGPVPVEGAAGGAITLDARGGVVLVVGLAEASATAAGQIARQLTALGGLPGSKLREAGVAPDAGGGLAARHAAWFDLSEPAELNSAQRCVLVVGAEPPDDARAAVEAELGDSLAGLYLTAGEGVTSLTTGAEPEVAEAPEVVEEPEAPEEPEAEIVLEPETPPEAEEPEAEAPAEAETAVEPPVEGEAPVEDEASMDVAAPVEGEAPVTNETTVDATPVETEPEAEAPADELEAPGEGEAPVEDQAGETEILDAETAGAEDADAPAEPEGPGSIEVALDDAPHTGTALDDDAAHDGTAQDEAAPDLVAPYLQDETSTIIVEESDLAEAKELQPAGRFAGWPVGNWIGLTMILVGIGIGIIGVISLRDSSDETARPEPNEQISTVATGVTPDATHARWIGQQRVVTLSDGTMVFVYPTEESLNLVKDGASSGATWEEPFVLDEVVGAKSLSVDVDSKDRLHVAYSDGDSVNYVRLKNKPEQWKPSRLIQIDDDTTDLHVDVAWDEQNQTAHVVWVQQSTEGDAPAYAALTSEGGIHLTDEGVLTNTGQEVPPLVSVAADGRSSLLVTFRRADQTTGWSSRYSPGPSEDGTFEFFEEEELPTESFVGATDVVYDRQRTAHLVLREDDSANLTYYRKTEAEPWTTSEIALDGDRIEDVDFPTLTYNAEENNLYLFFQTEQYDPAGEISYLVRPLDGTGWQGPFVITTPVDVPEGALYPVAPDRVSVQALVFWTKTGDPYEIDAAPVRAP
ncbi:MAG TPA: hypothetical protein VEV43_15505 [Actinomycetota bacterium]|nr:hypothetical protein [Actinomycetota bacterium]